MLRNGKKPICVVCGLEDERILNVHHIDRNRQNNKLSNLVWVCMNCHYLIHHDIEFEKLLKTK
ncbi:HNH endonuclease [Candidatus Woesebacteria bacterium]|nr:HNH endonuclease [Candidatus Woesebacteria bacterium]